MQETSAIALISQSRAEARLSEPIVIATLTTFAALLRVTRTRCPFHLLTHAIGLLSGVDMTGLLLNNVFCNSAAHPSSRTAATAALTEIAELCAALRRVDVGEVSREARLCRVDASSHGLQGVSAAANALESMHGSLSTLLQAVVRTVGMPQRSADAPCLQGRHILRLSMAVLCAVCRALPCRVWTRCDHCYLCIDLRLCVYAQFWRLRSASAPTRGRHMQSRMRSFAWWCRAWSDAVGIFWLTRLLRDSDSRLRCDAAYLLATLIHPGTNTMRDAVLQAWPDGGTTMLRIGLSPRQPGAVSAAALTFAAVSMASPTIETVPEPMSHPQASVRRHPCTPWLMITSQ
jgi:hypothetical protein